MAKAIKRPIIRSDSEDSDIDNFDQEARSLISSGSLAKRPKPSVPAAQSSGSGYSSDSNSDAEWTMGKKNPPGSHIGLATKKMPANNTKKIRGGGKTMVYRKSAPKKPSSSSSDSSEDEDEDEDDDGNAQKQDSSSSGDSSSDSDSSSAESQKFDDGYDDNFIGDEADQKSLNGMLEAEREQEMFQRYEKREALKARFEIQQKLRRQKKHDKKKLHEEKVKQSLRDSRRKQQDRSKPKTKRFQAMSEYKAKRSADKIRKAEAEKSLDEKAPLRASDIFLSSESEYSSSDPSSSYEDETEKTVVEKPGTVSTSDLSKIRLSRYRLEKWVHMPFFSTIIVGCFVRIGIGAHEGRMVYRICEVIGAQEGPKVYSLGSTKTNKALKLRHGIQERIFRMEYVSNSPFSESEFEKWKVEMGKKGLSLPKIDFVKQKVRKLEEAKNKSLKEEDVEKIIQEKQRFRKNPRNYAMTKSRMIREKEMAEQEGDVEKVGSLTIRLAELEERADLLDKQRTKGLSAISYINERNRQKNMIRSEMALKEELAGMEGKEDDPFTRRKCQPTLLKLAGRDSGTSEQATRKKSAPIKEAGTDVNLVKASESTPNGKSSKLAVDSTPSQLSATPIHLKSEMDDLFSAHDFDIQIDLPSGSDDTSTPKTLPKSDTVPRQEGPKRSLNLADYKKRRGLI